MSGCEAWGWRRILLGTAAGVCLLCSAAGAQQNPLPAPSAPVEAVSASSGSGQEQAAARPASDLAPVRAARLTFLSGGLELQRVDNTAEDAPLLNMPLYAGTRLVTGDYGQAEVEFEDGSVVRLTPRSALSLDTLALDAASANTHLTLLSGLAYVELRRSGASTYVLGAGGLDVTPVENAVVRINLDQPSPTVSVLAGEARVERPGDSGWRAEVQAGASLRLDATDDSRYLLSAQISPESWDSWNATRDGMAADQADKRTVARDAYAGDQGYGWADLDANGSWYNLPGEGEVWQPDVADDGFDPYGFGAWVWGTAGYVWASGYTWGWTPYHCGSWEFFPALGWVWRPAPECGAWGFGAGGWGGVHVGKPPRNYKRVAIPLQGPGGVHPILVVHGADGPRPPVLRGEPLRIAGTLVTPLPVLGAAYDLGVSPLGQALARDYPIDAKTGKALLGRVPQGNTSQSLAVGGWHAVERTPGSPARLAVRPGGSGQPPAPAGAIPSAHPAGADRHPPAPGTVVTTQAPARTPEPPQPAPVHTAPPPPPAAHSDPAAAAKPKG